MTNELSNQSMQTEIMQLRFELQKLQAEKSSRLEDSLFAPSLFNHYQKVAETVAKSSMIPNAYRGKPEDIFVAMAMGYQLGFPVEQSLQDIAVINGRPCLWGDGLLSLVLNHPECKDIKEEPIYNGQVVVGYICTVTRKGHEPHSKSFTMQDADRAGLLKKGGVWSAYPERMLQMRARSLALRDKFADALRGLRVAEVEQDDATIIEGEVVKTDTTTQVDKLKKVLQLNNTPAQPEKIVESPKDVPEKSEEEKNKPATPSQISKIEILMEEKGFDETRRKNALTYFKIKSLSELTFDKAEAFLMHLDRK